MEAKGPHSKAGPSTQTPVLRVSLSGDHDPTGCQADDGKVRCAARATYSSPSAAALAGELVAAGSPGVAWRAGLELECRGFRKNGNGLGTREC